MKKKVYILNIKTITLMRYDLDVPYNPPDHVFRGEYKTAYEGVVRFGSPESAKRYLEKFSLLDKILCNLSIHPKSQRYRAAKIAKDLSPFMIRSNRNISYSSKLIRQEPYHSRKDIFELSGQE